MKLNPTKKSKVLKLISKTISLFEKCGGAGGTPGPCPTGGSGKPRRETYRDSFGNERPNRHQDAVVESRKPIAGHNGIHDAPVLPKIKGITWGSHKNSDRQNPTTGEIEKTQVIPYSANQGRGEKAKGSLTIFSSRDGTFGHTLGQISGSEGWGSKAEAIDAGVADLKVAFKL